MFDTAYLTVMTNLSGAQISFDVKRQTIDHKNNYFTFDGQIKHSILDFPISFKIKTGRHTVVITSGTGETWEFSTELDYQQEWVIEVSLSGRDIVSVRHGERKVSNSTYMMARKLK